MAGRMGGEKVTTLNLAVVESDVEQGVILVSGAVPGPKGGLVMVRDAVKCPPPPKVERLMAQVRSRARRRRCRHLVEFLDDAIFGIEPNGVAVMHQVYPLSSPPVGRAPRAPRPAAEVARRRCQALEAEGHRSGPPGLHPLPAVGRRRCGPRAKPRFLRPGTPMKMVRLGLGSALSDRASEGKVLVVDDWGFERPLHQGRRGRIGATRRGPGAGGAAP